jgi:hypothetical protein
LSLLDGHGTIQPHKLVAAMLAQLLKHVQGLRVVGDKHHLLTGCALEHGQNTIHYHHLATKLGLHLIWSKVGREQVGKVSKAWLSSQDFVVNQLRVGAKLFEMGDKGQGRASPGPFLLGCAV